MVPVSEVLKLVGAYKIPAAEYEDPLLKLEAVAALPEMLIPQFPEAPVPVRVGA